MIEIQAICYILENGLKGFRADWFIDQRDKFDFIENFYKKYGKIPDKLTFVDKFKDFKCFHVEDPYSSIVDRLKEEALYKRIIPAYNEAGELITAGKSNEACKMLVDKISNLQRELSSNLSPVDLTDPKTKQKLYKELVTGVTKFPTGLSELDSQFGGWNSKDFVVIFARLGIGKSWISEYFAYNLVKEGFRVGYYSGEMSAVEVSLRLDTFNTNKSNVQMFNGGLTEREYEDVAEEFSSLPGKFFVLTPEELGDGATVGDLKRFIEDQKLEALFIDQISLMKRNPKLSTTEAIASLSNELRILQSITNIPFFVISQQNRVGLQDKDSKGKDDIAATISYSDTLGQNATLAFYLDYNSDNRILCLNMVKSRRSHSQKFSYSWDIDKGTLRYIPIGEDGKDCDEDPEDYGDDEEQPF